MEITTLFSGFSNLLGGTGIDNFVINNGGSISGLIDGGSGAGVNTLTSNNSAANTWLLTSLYAGTLNGDSFTNIQSLVGNSAISDSLTGINQNNDWVITSANTGSVALTGDANLQNFSGMENLIGNAANDSFVLQDGGSISGLIDGVSASGNTLTSNNSAANIWLLTSLYTGTLNGDGFTNIQSLVGNSAISDSLTGINQNNDWVITSTNTGSVALNGDANLQNFSGMESLIGNIANDSFVLQDGGSISGLVDGVSASGNTLTSNNSAANTWLLTSLYTGSLNGDGFANIQSLVGNSAISDSLTGINQNNDWIDYYMIIPAQLH